MLVYSPSPAYVPFMPRLATIKQTRQQRPTNPAYSGSLLCVRYRRCGLRLHLHHVEWAGNHPRRSSSYDTPGHFPSCASRL